MDTNKSKETVRILMKDNNYQEISQEEFSTRLLSAREDERKMIARNLHDGLGQMLTVLSFDLVRITKMLETEQSVVAPLVSDLLTNVESAIEMVQELSLDLRPSILDNLGLRAAIEWSVGEFQIKTGIRCQLVCKQFSTIVNNHLATNIFRVFQELLTNVARHSKATRLNINLKVINDEATFVIADNGRGITEDEVSSIKSIGILGIKERVCHSNGNIKFFGISGKGTTVTMSFPVNN